MKCLNCNNEVPEEVYRRDMIDDGKEFLPFCSSECDHAHHRKMEDGYKVLFKNPDVNDVLRKELQSLREQVEELKSHTIGKAVRAVKKENQQLKDQLSKYREVVEAAKAVGEREIAVWMEDDDDGGAEVLDALDKALSQLGEGNGA